MSEQLRDMEARLRKAWAERGWTYPEPSLAGLPPRLETTVKNSAGGTYALLAAFCGFILLPYSWILSPIKTLPNGRNFCPLSHVR